MAEDGGGDFLWGVASAAYQVEGAPRADGKGPSKWDVYTNDDRVTEAVIGKLQTGNTAINQYDPRQYRSDVAVMRKLGVNAYRFSIAWTRILPDGTGAVNHRGLDYYRRLVDELLAAGIEPMATLYHWDFPQVLQLKGGWANADSPAWFADYAAAAFAALGDRVPKFVTLNEPFIDLFLMDATVENIRSGAAEPYRHSSAQYGRQAQAMHHMLLGHGRAVEAYRASGRAGMVGIALSLMPTRPADPGKADDVAAAALADAVINRWPLDAVLAGTYPDEAIAAFRAHNPDLQIADPDLAVLKANRVDFVGVNFYAPVYVPHDPEAALGFRWLGTNPDPAPAAFNGPVRPEALTELLLRIHRDYGAPPIIITENGAGFGPEDEVADADIVRDPLRTGYVRRHIAAALEARAAGADLRGYMLWSIFDNFEWLHGFERRFGLVHVDFESQARTPKESWYAYRDHIAAWRKAAP
jgi:beta-glucosidase